MGRTRFIVFTGVFWALAFPFVVWRRRWLLPIWFAFLAVYSVWWCGFAPIAVLYFLGSCFLLGRIFKLNRVLALLGGLAMWIFVCSVTAHFVVNTRVAWGIALAIPYFIKWRNLRCRLPDFSRSEMAALALLLFVLTAHWLVALKPEVSPDGLSTHLMVPLAIAHNGGWNFDFRTYTWALQTLGGEFAFTLPVILGGESAASLMNFAMLAAIAALVYEGSKRYASRTISLLCTALFASTPLVQLVTGSLFVENIWTALVLTALLLALRYLETRDGQDLMAIAMLAGAAMSVKPLAAPFLIGIGAICIARVIAARATKPALKATMLFLVFAAPPYAYAWLKTGNPVFPQLNQVFHSPYLSGAPLSDPRFQAPLRLTTPYEVTFRTHEFNEGQNGGVGFQYFLLLLPAAILIRQRDQTAILAIAALGALLILATLPNVRYIYPALAMFSIAIAWLAAELPETIPVMLGLVALNIYFFPSSGWNNRDFALFRKEDVQPYIEQSAPQRILIEQLNRESHGEPVAFFGTDSIAGLHALAYSDSWHSEQYWTELRKSRNPEDVFRIMQSRRIRHLIAPKNLQSVYTMTEKFLRRYAEPKISVGDYALFQLSDAPKIAPRAEPAPPGIYDDHDPQIDYEGQWIHDRQFADAAAGSITYSNNPGDAVRFSFSGNTITWVFTKAVNRGSADVLIDGQSVGNVNLRSEATEWQQQHRFENLPPGPHTIEIRILSGFIDVDRFIVE